MSGAPVKLYVYDLSNGLARQMSMSLTGRQIDGIWHTAVVVYGQEFYFGQGILTSPPGGTHLGQPLEIVDMGETYLPEEVVIEYIESQRSVFTPEKYHLLDFNCNTFSNSLCQFLTGSNIPKHITDLPADFLNTPFGQSMRPMIEGMFGRSQVTPPVAQPGPNADSINMLRDVSSAALSAAPQPAGKPPVLQNAPNAATLKNWLQSYKAVVVFFTSATCPPCRMIKPDFERLVREKNDTDSSRIKLLGVTVDTGVAYDAGAEFGIRATPTFMLFHNNAKFSEFRGANYAELESSVNLLLFTAYPPHPHRKIHQLRGVLDLPNKPVLYNTPGKVDMIYSKLESFLDQDGIKLDEQNKIVLEQSKKAITDPKVAIDMAGWSSLIDLLLEKLPLDHQFPLLDVFRTLLATKAASEYYMNDCSQLVRLIENGYKQENVPKATLLMTLRACNIFAHNMLVTTYFTSTLPAAANSRASLTQLLVSSLLSPESQVRQTAASLAFNCATVVADERLKKEKEDGYLEGMAEQEDDDWQIEIVSAIMDDLSKETDEQVIHRLLGAIAKFVFLAPSQSSVADLLSALEIKSVLDSKKKIISSPTVSTLAKEVLQLVDSSVSGH
ncbi:PPPDE putative peptidase domain-containing protein [Fennellomyces sp. T-0311]|nr:PPPDE putative peptidase domain-containing protein [Fennellomyces sp. T-0311]